MSEHSLSPSGTGQAFWNSIPLLLPLILRFGPPNAGCIAMAQLWDEWPAEWASTAGVFEPKGMQQYGCSGTCHYFDEDDSTSLEIDWPEGDPTDPFDGASPDTWAPLAMELAKKRVLAEPERRFDLRADRIYFRFAKSAVV